RVPVVDVQNDNFTELWPSMVLSLRTATFIAVDTVRGTCLAPRRPFARVPLSEEVAGTDSGPAPAPWNRQQLPVAGSPVWLCMLSLQSDNAYLCQIYNLTLLCMEDYVVEPQSVQFLVQHGFDFNKQYSQGIPYHKGNDKGNENQSLSVRTFFLELIRAKKPLVLHNGLIDLVFLYQCFYAHLPDSLGTFTADLSEMFPAGIYDTKYASEFETRFIASYLEYAYKKCKRENSKLKDSSSQHLTVEFCNYPANMSCYIDYRHCFLEEESHNGGGETKVPVCEKFSAYGWCPKGVKCPQSHNIDLIIDEDDRLWEEKRKKRKKKWKRRKNTEEPAKAAGEENSGKEMELAQNGEEGPPRKQSCHESAATMELAEITPKSEDTSLEENSMDMESEVSSDTRAQWEEDLSSKERTTEGHSPPSQGGTHRAGFDAFMTGYVMAYVWVLKKGKHVDNGAGPWLPDCHNKLYLSGKSVPLQIVKSLFSKSSKAHSQKMKLAWASE
ncbi:TOE1 protein, partial [Tricholaema leucomelas]|nr:TOE1 protein [Tricholaema leucomelas]